tara:strand:- start:1175 stop:2443 length:1269 start_codon:yes stop_codon:yes gene_type:complete
MLSLFKLNSFQKKTITLFVFLSFTNTAFTQERVIKLDFQKIHNGSSYWWVNNNNFGQKVSDINFNNRFESRRSNTTYVIHIFSGLKDNNLQGIYLNESFIKYNFSEETFLRFGKYYRDFSTYMNDELSSGSMLVSNNAQAMKKIGLVSTKKVEKNNDINFNFGISHALFSKNKSYIEAPLLHEKFIYINIKKSHYELGIGFVHEAIWGGTISNIGKQPGKFKDFLKIFIAADGDLMEGQSHANALGNHLGIWDFYYIKSQNNKKLKLYYQHFFEDTSGLRFANKLDGLWGIELVEYLPNTNIVLEYLNTSNQSIDPPYVDDSYYNHFEYIDGWSYKGHSIGNPYIEFLETNPLEMFHLGIMGSFLNKYNYQFLGSRRIDSSDNIKYKIKLEKEVKKNSLFLNTFILNDSQKNGIGFGIYWVQ